MRVVCGLMAVVMIGFAAVQYNDPDFVFWGAVYGIGALWTGFAAFSPSTLWWTGARIMLVICFAAAIWGVTYFWPASSHWWSRDVWWVTETAREGMGMMAVLLALICAAFVALRPGTA